MSFYMSIDDVSRRRFLERSGLGFGGLALSYLLNAAPATNPLSAKAPPLPATAKNVIFMFMHGGPSHLDTFDPKPLLTRDHGKPLPFKRPLTFAEGDTGSLLKSPWQFRQYGQSGIPVSELFPNVAQHVDDICVLRSV